MKIQKDNTEFDLLISFICFSLIMLVIVFSSCKKAETQKQFTPCDVRLIINGVNCFTCKWGVNYKDAGNECNFSNKISAKNLR